MALQYGIGRVSRCRSPIFARNPHAEKFGRILGASRVIPVGCTGDDQGFTLNQRGSAPARISGAHPDEDASLRRRAEAFFAPRRASQRIELSPPRVCPALRRTGYCRSPSAPIFELAVSPRATLRCPHRVDFQDAYFSAGPTMHSP